MTRVTNLRMTATRATSGLRPLAVSLPYGALQAGLWRIVGNRSMEPWTGDLLKEDGAPVGVDGLDQKVVLVAEIERTAALSPATLDRVGGAEAGGFAEGLEPDGADPVASEPVGGQRGGAGGRRAGCGTVPASSGQKRPARFP